MRTSHFWRTKMITVSDHELLIKSYTPGLVITNEGREDGLWIYLPEPFPNRRLEFIQLAIEWMHLNTNNSKVKFLCSGYPSILNLEGSADTFGRNLIIESYNDKFWRIVSTTFTTSQITFEE